jgi:hypothetical protein
VATAAGAAHVVPIQVLQQRAAQLWDARRACDYVQLTTLLPRLVDDLHVHARRRMLRALGWEPAGWSWTRSMT